MADLVEMEVDMRGFNAALYELARETGRSFADVLKHNGRQICVTLAYSTQPYGKNPAAHQLGVNAVKRDLGIVYATPSKIFKLIADTGDEDAARGFYKLVTTGNIIDAREILVRLGIDGSYADIGPFDKRFHDSRRNNRGRVNGGRPSQIVTNPKVLREYRREVAKRVGFAKSGWAAPARGLGGTRGMPAWVSGNNGPGSLVDNSRDPIHPHIILRNNVSYINQVLTPQAIEEAIRIQREKMLSQVEHVVAYNAKKVGWHSEAA